MLNANHAGSIDLVKDEPGIGWASGRCLLDSKIEQSTVLWNNLIYISLRKAERKILTAGLAQSTAFNKSGRALDDSSVTKVSKFIAWSLSCWFSAAIQSLALGSKKMAGYK